ncbi:MAG: PD-(D/E)XK nuclease family protein, partial [Myxococcota bacterium]|nr:PD-(D/E)XK nuclease family protein [Myxococcota bacterium]
PAELVALPAERGGLVMLSYTRLAHDLAVPMTAAKPGDALAIDPAEFDVDDASGTADVAPLVGPDDLPPGAASGLLLHDVFEIADVARARAAPDAVAWSADPEVALQLADAARARGIDARYLPHAARILHATLTRPLALTDGSTLPALADAPRFAREVEFSYPLASGRGLVRGFIDALVVIDDELWVLDYKSDVLAGDDRVKAAHERVASHYAVQARLYALAADRFRGNRRLAGLLFAFVRHDLVAPLRIEPGTLETWRAWLATIAARPTGEVAS